MFLEIAKGIASMLQWAIHTLKVFRTTQQQQKQVEVAERVLRYIFWGLSVAPGLWVEQDELQVQQFNLQVKLVAMLH